MDIKQNIINKSKELGIDSIGFCSPDIPKADIDNYLEYLKLNNHHHMDWLKTRKHLRLDPNALHEGTRTVIVLGLNYCDHNKPEYDYEISVYANQTIDYHHWVYDKAKLLVKYLADLGGNSRCFVDSAPILEKVFAKKTNVGWQGKHSCIVSREFGSWLFLGVIFTNLEIPFDQIHKDLCGSCRKCIDACPTGALSEYKLDVGKCISYLSIEHQGEIKKELANEFGNKIFGCDECLKACHFNKFEQPSKHPETNYNQNFPKSLAELNEISEEKFMEVFHKTPIKRLGLKRLKRNIAIIENNTKI